MTIYVVTEQEGYDVPSPLSYHMTEEGARAACSEAERADRQRWIEGMGAGWVEENEECMSIFLVDTITVQP